MATNTNKSAAFLNIFVLNAQGEQISVGGIGLQLSKQLDRSILKLTDDRVNNLNYQFQLNTGSTSGLLDLGVPMDQSIANYQATTVNPADGWLNVSVIDANGTSRRLGGIKLVLSNMVHRSLIAAKESFSDLRFDVSVYRINNTNTVEFAPVEPEIVELGDISELDLDALESIDRSQLNPGDKGKLTRRINKLRSVDQDLAEAMGTDPQLPF